MSQQKKGLPWRMLAISLAIIVLFSFLASMFNTGMFSTSVKRISFDTEHGTLSGLLYMPKGASEEDPRPTVIVTHGYLNSAEMQDANAIELSRRGYVVLALDMYDHGHSDIMEENYHGGTGFMNTWAPFWVHSMYDAVKYMYDQPYVLKDEADNGIIGITGHSMGGFSSTMAVYYDEFDNAPQGFRMIRANLTEGSDFYYTSIVPFLGVEEWSLETTPRYFVNAQTFDAAGGGRYLGKVAAQYDEFFFNAPDAPEGTVRHKDYVSTPDGMTFLQQAEPAKADTWYDTSDGGHRIIYQPAQTHPWNHFSTKTTGHAIDFYNTAFADYVKTEPAGAGSQIWYWKEICECVALVGFVLFILSVASVFIRVPGLAKAATGELKPQASAKGIKLVATILITLIAIALPALLFETMYGWSPKDVNMQKLSTVALSFAIGGLIVGLNGYGESKNRKWLFGAIAAILAGVGLYVLTKNNLYTDTAVWTAPVVNSVAKWTVGSTFISFLIMAVSFVFLKNKDEVKLADYGVTFKPTAILAGLCTGLLTVAAAYGLLFLIDLIFKTDFRIWTFAFKTFDANIFPAILRYLPTFLAFYMVSTAAICINTNTERLQGWKGYLLAACLNAGGITVWLIRQYVTLFSTGVAAHPGADLSGIVLVAMVPTLAIAGIISRYLYKRTGSIWLPAFLNGILMTVMTVANTTVFFK
ncbi:MAG: alpha/beta hydrolase [Clostridia bacterium]|nr:alpha/beta hydrolase [Clostridia bacterium]